MQRVALLALIALVAIGFADAQTIPQMDSRPAPLGENVAPKTLPEAQATFSIALPSPTLLERIRLGNVSATHTAIGFGRVPMGLGIDSRILVPGGIRAIQLTVSSPGAAHLRTRIATDPNSTYRVSASPINSDRKAEESAVASGVAHVWTPITDGDVQRLIIESENFNKPWPIAVDLVSHIEAALTSEPLTVQLKAAAACQVDYACIYSIAPAVMQASLPLASEAVARMVYNTPDGAAFLCTGTLLNTASYPAPIFLTAAHCIADQATASSLVTYWHYRRDLCGSVSISPNMRQIGGGGTLLYTSSTFDATLLKLNTMPPSTANYSGWNASAVPAGEIILALHNPTGDVQKGSFGTTLGPTVGPITIGGVTRGAGTYDVVLWDVGITEGGSSGSGLFTYDANKNFFYTRGTLTGGVDSCGAPLSHTYYSRLVNYYPAIASFLTQTTPSGTKALAVEYYHAAFGHFFITANPDEISKLDAGVFAGWARTGQVFNVFTSAGTGLVPVCRFFTVAFPPTSSHFYAPRGLGCEGTLTNKDWQFEGDVFYTALPDAGGACLAGNVPVYRLYNNRQGGAPNHRFTTSPAVRAQMLASGYIAEGTGIGVGLCSPN